MIIRQGFKFRLYPEPQQRRVLACWWGGKRYVANLALEQRRAFSRRRTVHDWPQGRAKQAQDAYVAERRAAGRKPFLDGPHFELPAAIYP